MHIPSTLWGSAADCYIYLSRLLCESVLLDFVCVLGTCSLCTRRSYWGQNSYGATHTD